MRSLCIFLLLPFYLYYIAMSVVLWFNIVSFIQAKFALNLEREVLDYQQPCVFRNFKRRDSMSSPNSNDLVDVDGLSCSSFT